MLLRIVWAIYVILVSVTAVAANENATANKIFVETMQFLDQAAAAKPSEAIGLYEKALQNLDKIVTRYPGSDLAVKIISGQAIGQVHRGEIEKTLSEVRKAAECLGKLSAFCVAAEALTMARSIQDAGSRAGALMKLAAAQAQARMRREANDTLAEALATARSIQDADSRAGVLMRLAPVQAQAGNVSEALTTARSIQNVYFGYFRARALREIAAVQAQAGMRREANDTLAEALTTAHSIQGANFRAWALGEIAAVQAQAGMRREANDTLAKALTTARSIQDMASRAGALTKIAVAQAQAGMSREANDTLAEALTTAHSIPYALLRAMTLSESAAVQAQAGKVPEALTTARSIQDADSRARALAALIEPLVKMELKK